MGSPEIDAGLYIPTVVHGTQDPCVSDIAFTQGRSNGGENFLMQPISYGIRTANTSSNGWGIQKEVTHTLDCAQGVAVAQPVDFRNLRYHDGDVSGTMQSKSSGGYSLNYMTGIQTSMAVRRLTPVECERLQGFPDNYTNIPWRKNPEAPDGPRYKALGNSWAVPNVRWIGKRIQEALNDL